MLVADLIHEMMFEEYTKDEEDKESGIIYITIKRYLESLEDTFFSIYDVIANSSARIIPFLKSIFFYFCQVMRKTITIYNIEERQPFDFIDPPIIPIQHLQTVIHKLEDEAEIPSKYQWLGFNKLEFIQMLSEIRIHIKQHYKQTEIVPPPDMPDGISNKHKDLKDKVNCLNITTQEKFELLKNVEGLARTDKKKTDFIFSLITVYGGEDMARNPRQYFIEKKGDIQTGYKKAEKNAILNAFERKGLTFPVSGRTLEKWLNS
ncbi:hypothetical protein NYR68_00355 [Actinobacillus equuli subsp. haemolyticus]|uniref:hypothetical protein n=1 Tax=Actinobacillus equuli TaxID=718 RepID=UPI002446679D|nr:hypothetical protein [Actinobacillus equuli]WGE50882.1 hypothetical protein NYR68_00355 [Actinobacillus equuli subsp. haemolyticus]